MMLTFTPRSAAARSMRSSRYCSFALGGRRKYSSGLSHQSKIHLIRESVTVESKVPEFVLKRVPKNNPPKTSRKERPLAITYNTLFRLLDRNRNSPHVAAPVNEPFHIISCSWRGKTHKAIVPLMPMQSMTRLIEMRMRMYLRLENILNFTESTLDCVFNAVKCRLGIVEERHQDGLMVVLCS